MEVSDDVVKEVSLSYQHLVTLKSHAANTSYGNQVLLIDLKQFEGTWFWTMRVYLDFDDLCDM